MLHNLDAANRGTECVGQRIAPINHYYLGYSTGRGQQLNMEIDTGSAYSVPACMRGNVPKARNSTHFINSTNYMRELDIIVTVGELCVKYSTKNKGETGFVRHCRDSRSLVWSGLIVSNTLGGGRSTEETRMQGNVAERGKHAGKCIES